MLTLFETVVLFFHVQFLRCHISTEEAKRDIFFVLRWTFVFVFFPLCAMGSLAFSFWWFLSLLVLSVLIWFFRKRILESRKNERERIEYESRRILEDFLRKRELREFERESRSRMND